MASAVFAGFVQQSFAAPTVSVRITVVNIAETDDFPSDFFPITRDQIKHTITSDVLYTVKYSLSISRNGSFIEILDDFMRGEKNGGLINFRINGVDGIPDNDDDLAWPPKTDNPSGGTPVPGGTINDEEVNFTLKVTLTDCTTGMQVDAQHLMGIKAYETMTSAPTGQFTATAATLANEVAECPIPINAALTDPAQDTTTEAGSTVTFTVKLASEPTAAVDVTVTSDKPTEGLVSTSDMPMPAETLTLTFTTSDWNTPQTVIVTGQDDEDDEDSVATTFTISFAGEGLRPGMLELKNADNDDVPGRVTNLQVATAESGMLRVTWDAPANAATSPITEYQVSWATAAAPDAEISSATVTASERQYDISGLQDGIAYQISVIAVSSASGNGETETATGTSASGIPASGALRLRLRVFLESALP